MKLLFNGNLIEEPVPWSVTDRAFQYGDGYFETMIFRDGQIRLLDYHLDRVHRAATVFRFDLPESEFRYLEENAGTLIQLNEIDSEQVRVKLTLWRRAAGQQGYRTGEHHVNWALMVFPHDTGIIRRGLRTGFSENVTLHASPWSGMKTLSALPYVMAGLECSEKDLDDLILLNRDGMITECIESNLFWLTGNIWHTPHPATGCVQGVMRTWLMEMFANRGEIVRECLEPADAVIPDQAFTCNASGFGLIGTWDGREIRQDPGILTEWVALLEK